MTVNKRRLDPLPGHGAGVEQLRDWLTVALEPVPGYKVRAFIRAGRQRKDPCELVLDKPGGGLVKYRFPEQRELATAGSLRATVYAVCDGFCRMPALGKGELEDVWAALCMLAQVLVDQSERDEASEWLDGMLATCDQVTGLTLGPAGRYDALQALRARRQFTRRHAEQLTDRTHDPREQLVRPALVLDLDGTRWLRAAEVATYVRHVVGVQISQPTLDARLAEIDVGRVVYEERRGAAHPKLTLYRLPGEPVEAPENESVEASENGNPTVPVNPTNPTHGEHASRA